MQFANVHLRKACRDLDENHDLAIGVLDDLVNWVVGTGLTIEPMAALKIIGERVVPALRRSG